MCSRGAAFARKVRDAGRLLSEDATEALDLVIGEPLDAVLDIPSLMTAIRAREHERVRVQGRLAELAATSQVARMDRVRLDRDLRQRLTRWQGLSCSPPRRCGRG